MLKDSEEAIVLYDKICKNLILFYSTLFQTKRSVLWTVLNLLEIPNENSSLTEVHKIGARMVANALRWNDDHKYDI